MEIQMVLIAKTKFYSKGQKCYNRIRQMWFSLIKATLLKKINVLGTCLNSTKVQKECDIRLDFRGEKTLSLPRQYELLRFWHKGHFFGYNIIEGGRACHQLKF